MILNVGILRNILEKIELLVDDVEPYLAQGLEKLLL